MIDGLPVNDPIGSGLGISINTNALEQMEVITGGFNAEHGNAQSGVINLITKAGTKSFRVESAIESGSGRRTTAIQYTVLGWIQITTSNR